MSTEVTLFLIQYCHEGTWKDFVPPISAAEQPLEQVVEIARALKPLSRKGRVLVLKTSQEIEVK